MMELLKQAQRHKVAKAQRNKNIKNSVPLCLSASAPDRNGFIFSRNPQSAIRNEKGMALVIIVAIIAILSAIGVSFMYTMRMEEKAAFNYMNGLKASYIAKSGIEHAIAVLKSDGKDTGFVSYELSKWGYKDTDLNDSTFSAYVNDDDNSVNNDTTYISPLSDSSKRMDSRWLYVHDENGIDIVGRYAVLITDESSKININTAGNVSGTGLTHNQNQGWHVSEISIQNFIEAGNASIWPFPFSISTPAEKSKDIVLYRYGPDGVPGNINEDHFGDSLIIQADGIDNDASGNPDDEDEWLYNPSRFAPWNPFYNNLTDDNYDTAFITIEEIKEVTDIGDATFQKIKPYITVYSSDENTTDSGFLRLNINLVKDAASLYTVMYSAWEDLIEPPYSLFDYEELKRLSAQCAVNTLDYADNDNVSTFLEISREDTGLSTGSTINTLTDNLRVGPEEWTNDEWVGAKIIVVLPGTNVKQVRTIDWNDKDTVRVTRDWNNSIPIPNGSYYHIEDKATARGAEAIRINEIMVKPAYQWEAEELFKQQWGGGTEWYDTDLYYKGIYSKTASTPTDPKTITSDMEIWREGFYRLKALTYSSAPYIGIVEEAGPDTLLDNGATWSTDKWIGAKVTVISDDPLGTGAKIEQTRRVVSNTGDILSIDSLKPWTTEPDLSDTFSVAQDHSFTIRLISSEPGVEDIVKEAGTRNIGGWLLEDFGVVEVKAGIGTIELETTENTNTHNGAYLDYIQLSQQPDCEYVELVNISDNDVNIGGWVLTTSAGWVGTIPDDTIIEKRGYMVLAVDRKDDLWLMFDQQDVPVKGKDDIYFEHTWPNVTSDKRVVQLELSTAPVNIAEDGLGDTFILAGSIFTDSPLEIPAGKEESGEYTAIDENTLQIGSSPWLTDQWKGATITAIIDVYNDDASDSQITRQVFSNTPDIITITTKWDWSGAVIDESDTPYYYISFKPMAVTLYKGSLAEQQIVSQVNYLAEDINRVCYEQENGVKVYGFIALEKDDPTAMWDRDGDGIDDWWHINKEDSQVPGIRGGTPGDDNSVCVNKPTLAINANVPNLPFATVGDVKDVSRMRIEYSGWATATGSQNTLIHNSSPWASDNLKGAYILIVSGKGAGQIREIESNTSNTITVTENWTTVPDDTSEYYIFFEWSKIGSDDLGYEDRELVKRLADKITVSQKRLEAENNTWTSAVWTPSGADFQDTFLTPYYYTDTTDEDTWIWGIDQRLNPDTAIYELYISGRVVKDGFDSPDTALVTVTTGVGNPITREISFAPDNIADFGQITIGGDIAGVAGEFLQLEMWKDYDVNSIYFDAVILAPEYRTYGRININTADTVILQSLPGITQPIATAIVNYRQDLDGDDDIYGTADDGPFNNIGEILNVIDPATGNFITLDTFSKISNLITTKSKVFTIISTGQALRESDKGDITYNTKTYEILGEKKYMVIMER